MSRVTPESLRAMLAGSGPVRGQSALGSCAVEVRDESPCLMVAVHAGRRIRPALRRKLVASPTARQREEDRFTDRFIEGASATVTALDSRFEYDVNREGLEALPLDPARCWGLVIYDRPLSDEEAQLSLDKRREFIAVVEVIVERLIRRFGRCIVFDIHSYNLTRQVARGIGSPPTFNVGTALLDRQRWSGAIETWLQELGRIRLAGRRSTVAENLVFQGRGHLCRHLTARYEDVLVLPTEVAKVYLDEESGRADPAVVEQIRVGLFHAARRLTRSLLDPHGPR